jgi:hypothetical protein
MKKEKSVLRKSGKEKGSRKKGEEEVGFPKASTKQSW